MTASLCVPVDAWLDGLTWCVQHASCSVTESEELSYKENGFLVVQCDIASDPEALVEDL